MSTGRVLLGIAGAAITGAVIGMLIAPERGKDLRKRLNKMIGEWANEISQATNDLRKTLEEGKQVMREGKEVVKGTAERSVKIAEHNGEDLKESLKGKE